MLLGLILASLLGYPSPLPSLLLNPRSPQITVNGSGLQSLFSWLDDSLDVHADQGDVELLSVQYPSSSFPTSSELFALELVAGITTGSLGLYAGHEVAPVLMPIFSAGAGTGWFAFVSFRTPPDRVVVNVYDESGQLRTTTVSLGGDRSGIGFYLQNANGTFYTQDTRNPGARAQALWYAGTGINNGTLFFAWEDQALAQGADSDFDDVVVYLQPPWPGPRTTPCERTTWGVLKARFR